MKDRWREYEWLLEQFSHRGATILSVSTTAGCDPRTITRWLKRHGLRTRSMAENASWRQATHDSILSRSVEIIEGELLGDGCLSSSSSWTSRYQQTSKWKLYLEWLANELALKGSNILPIHGKFGTVYHWGSHSYTELYPIYQRWYGIGEKNVPLDIHLTPLMCLHWYLGDGCLLTESRGRWLLYYVRLSTDSFLKKDVDRLAEQLRDHDAHVCRYQKHIEYRGYRIIVKSSFLNWIGPCPEAIRDIYGYKWAICTDPRPQRIWRNQYASGIRSSEAK